MSRTNQMISDLLRFNNALNKQKRSRFDKSYSHLTCIDSADLVPIGWDLVLPGDEKEIRVSALARMTTPFVPVMDSAQLYVASFFVPHRLWWSNAKKFYGENLDAEFNEDGEYEFPSLLPSLYRVDVGGENEHAGSRLNDYLGFPVISADACRVLDTLANNGSPIRANAGLHRSYQIIWNDYFRNSSIQPALKLSTGDTVTSTEWLTISKLRQVNKNPDYFTTMLRRPQAGNDVSLPLGDWAPIVTRSGSDGSIGNAKTNVPLRWYNTNNGGAVGPSVGVSNIFLDDRMTYASQTISPGSNAEYSSTYPIAPNNLWANLTDATAATINNIRAAVTIQHLLETDNAAGKRFNDIIYAHFGTMTADATLQRPELLGITKTQVGMRQVLQTGPSAGESSGVGNTGAVSVTSLDNAWVCNKAFTEPGFIMHLAWIRPEHSYSQGLNPLLTKLDRYEQYWPAFDNIGNQPVKKSAIFMAYNENTGATLDTVNDGESRVDSVFGYEEAWTPYRISHNRVSSLMRPDVNGSLASWNYTTYLKDTPTLNSAFITEDKV